jgi:hypothetical protein
MYLNGALHDGSLWFLLACLAIVAGMIGMFTDSGSGITHHAYTKPGMGGELAADLPLESIGRAEAEPWLRRPRRG